MTFTADDFRTQKTGQAAVARVLPRGLRYGDIRLGDEYGHDRDVPQKRIRAAITLLVRAVSAAPPPGRLPLYREIVVPAVERIRWDDIGAYWGLTPEAAVSYVGRMQDDAGTPHRVFGAVLHADVDWWRTFLRAVENADVAEAILKPGAVVQIDGVMVAGARRGTWRAVRGWPSTARTRIE